MWKQSASLIGMGLLIILSAPAHAQTSDDQIREMIIQQSIASYSGRCPCPYNIMRNGRRCGGRSAYSRPGGNSPIRYKRDIPDAMVEEIRKQLSGS